jgi:hypothetical protein
MLGFFPVSFLSDLLLSQADAEEKESNEFEEDH